MGLLPLRAERTDGYYLNPVKFSLNCFLAALFVEIPGPVCLCFWGKLFVLLGVGGIELGGYFLIFFVHLEQ